MRAYRGVTSPSHKLDRRGVNTGTGIIRRRRPRWRAILTHHVAVGYALGAPDLEHLACRVGQIERLHEVPKQIHDTDRLRHHPDPARHDHDG